MQFYPIIWCFKKLNLIRLYISTLKEIVSLLKANFTLKFIHEIISYSDGIWEDTCIFFLSKK